MVICQLEIDSNLSILHQHHSNEVPLAFSSWFSIWLSRLTVCRSLVRCSLWESWIMKRRRTQLRWWGTERVLTSLLTFVIHKSPSWHSLDSRLVPSSNGILKASLWGTSGNIDDGKHPEITSVLWNHQCGIEGSCSSREWPYIMKLKIVGPLGVRHGISSHLVSCLRCIREFDYRKFLPNDPACMKLSDWKWWRFLPRVQEESLAEIFPGIWCSRSELISGSSIRSYPRCTSRERDSLLHFYFVARYALENLQLEWSTAKPMWMHIQQRNVAYYPICIQSHRWFHSTPNSQPFIL